MRLSAARPLPAAVADVVDTFLAAADDAAPGLLVGFHLTGSIAYGDYKAGRSDVDFVAVIDRPLQEADVEALRKVHASTPTRPALDGTYATKEQLRDGTTPEARFHDGVLAPHDEYGATPVTRHELVTIGVAVRGTIDPTEIEHDTGVLQRWVRDNLDTYWADWARKASGFTPLAVDALLPQGIEWAVLGIARMLYTLETGQVASKSDVAAWAVEHADDERFVDVVESARRIRNGRSVNPLKMFDRKAEALAFMAHVLQTAPSAPSPG